MKAVDYETQSILDMYLLFHYGRSEQILPYAFGPTSALHFPVRCVNELIDASKLSESSSALDLGCAVGRSSFELARYCDSVIGMDYSKTFITTAQDLQKEGQLRYTKKITGRMLEPLIAKVPEVIDRSRVQFLVGDAHDISEDIGTFDIVLAANLLCRMTNPYKLLERLPSLVKPGAQLILTTPNTWIETITPIENWLGARPETGEPLQAIKTQLEPDFDCVTVKDIPFLIHEHDRKFQWSVAQGSTWERRRV